MKKRMILASTLIAMMSLYGRGEITLPHFFTDNMVVQQKSQLTIPGKATPGAKIEVKTDWSNETVKVKADKDGNFRAEIATPVAGGPYTIIISDGNERKVLTNVLSGEVWLCSGQSNMEFPVKGWTQVMNADEVVATAGHPEVRLLQVRKNTSFSPLEDAEVNMGGWVEASSATMDFSAIAYFFAVDMMNTLGVPVGVIDATWGGTPAEAWTPADKLQGVAGFEDELAAIGLHGHSMDEMRADYGRRINEWQKKIANLDIDFDKSVLQTSDDWREIPVPGLWEYSVLPDFDGIVWMQTSVNLPATAAGKELTLHTGAIDNEDRTYFNGVLVGGNGAWDTPRNYSVAGNLVKAGENVISIKVTDYDGDGGIGGSADELYAEVDGQRYPLAGMWQYREAGNFKDYPHPVSVEGSSYPSVLYNAMIAPLNVMPVKGVLWYQGCANVGRAEQYEPLFQTLINSWREHWGAELPFYFVQLANWRKPVNVQPDSEWAALRAAQAKALQLPNTGMAVAIDLGNPADIHPTNKQEVARRLELLALNRVYDRPCVDRAPECVAASPKKHSIELQFDGEVMSKAGIVTGFIVGDGNGNFAYANVKKTGDNTLELSSPLIDRPKVARYNWADSPAGNLTGKTGLPVAPFASDL